MTMMKNKNAKKIEIQEDNEKDEVNEVQEDVRSEQMIDKLIGAVEVKQAKTK